MKFTDGYWLIRDEFEMHYSEQLRDYTILDDSLVLYAPFKKITHKGTTLNIGMSMITIDSPADDAIRVRMKHFEELFDPRYEIKENKTNVNIQDNKNEIVFKTGLSEVRIAKGENFNLKFFYDGELKTESLYRSQSYIKEKNGKNYYRDQLSIAPDELIYGLGERFTPFVKNGQVVDIWNEDSGASSEQTYINIPFYISNKSYGVLVNDKRKVSFEVASEDVAKVQFSVEGESLEYCVILGDTMKETLQTYTDLTGKPSLPPAWSFGLWMSTSFCTDYQESTVLKYIDQMIEKEIPFEVFHFDCFWMKEFEWMSFEWDSQVFPDPEGLIKKIHDRGKKVCVWINPYIGRKAKVFNELNEKGYLLKKQDGNVWQWDMWQSGMGILDFTNPDAVKWYQDKLSELIDIGVDSFKTDFGERIPTEDVIYNNEVDPIHMHNYYSYLYNKAVFELLEERLGENEALVFARSGAVGSQEFPVHWGGDNLSEFTSMIDSLRGGLSLMMSGFSYWSHDIGGFEDNTTEEIYQRWTQFGLLSTHSRYHANIEYRMPWLYGEKSEEVTRKFASLKNTLMPYLYSSAVESSVYGIPMMRPMVLEFQDDLGTHYLDKQYMIGDSLLVVPIFKEGGNVDYYLPKGKWYNILTNKQYDNSVGVWINETYNYNQMPLLVRENSVIIHGKQDETCYSYNEDVVVHVYNPHEGYQEHIFKYPEFDIKIEVTNLDGEILVNCTGLSNYEVIIYNDK
ncbi:alpha-xylosidase [Erysipelothrix urinaevulpis]|uniref:alpha-xylosidase n=1 Tax=Erysipelothrix urinaevulpis TaxID=2683717 RepID=UPI00135A7BA3|nr:alpha-xylosidase [Erysipelothrix urinaevulpis]